MIKKRFILTEQFSALQGVTFVKDECVDVDTYYTVDGAVDLLNELWEENEELNEENRELRMVIDGLKQQNQKFKGRLNDLGVEYYD